MKRYQNDEGYNLQVCGLYRLTHPDEWIFPTKYKIAGNRVEISKRCTLNPFRVDHRIYAGTIRKIEDNTNIFNAKINLEISSRVSDKKINVGMEGLSNQGVKQLKKNLKDIIEDTFSI